MKEAKAIFPLSQDYGPKNVLSDEDDSLGTEINVGYDPLWVPVGLRSSPMFSGGLKSHMILDISSSLPQEQAITAISILMWVRPTKIPRKTALVCLTSITGSTVIFKKFLSRLQMLMTKTFV